MQTTIERYVIIRTDIVGFFHGNGCPRNNYEDDFGPLDQARQYRTENTARKAMAMPLQYVPCVIHPIKVVTNIDINIDKDVVGNQITKQLTDAKELIAEMTKLKRFMTSTEYDRFCLAERIVEYYT